MMRVLILGAKGMLGRELQSIFTGHYDVYVDNRETLDITNKKMVMKRVKEVAPEVVINCAAITDIDRAEEEVDLAMQVNGYAVEHIARACESFGAKLIQLSTAYVFDGTNHDPYLEDSPKFPQSVYGKSKSLGEDLALNYCTNTYIIRTSCLYGLNGNSFVNQLLESAKNNEVVNVVHNLIESPTWTRDLALKIRELIEDNLPAGIYHFCNEGEVSWYDLAKEIFALKDIKTELVPIAESELNRKAKRPMYSVLNNSKTDIMRPWDEAIRDYLGVY